MPNMHRVPQNIKKVAERYGITLVFYARCKLARLCSRILGERRKKASGKSPQSALRCRCFRAPRILRKVLARKYELSIVNDKGAHFPAHCYASGYALRLMNKSKNREARKLAEGCYIRKRASVSVCDSSTALHSSEMGFLENVLLHPSPPLFSGCGISGCGISGCGIILLSRPLDFC